MQQANIIIKEAPNSCRVLLQHPDGPELRLHEFTRRIRGSRFVTKANKYAEDVQRVLPGCQIKRIKVAA